MCIYSHIFKDGLWAGPMGAYNCQVPQVDHSGLTNENKALQK